MNNPRHDPPIIPPGQVLPPMDPPTPISPRGSPRASAFRRGTTRDRFLVLNAFADGGARSVDPTAQACWWIVYRETKPNGLARVSHGRIAACIGVSRHTAMRAMRRLELAGLLSVARRGGLHGGASTYRAHPTPRLRSKAATPPVANGDPHA